MFRPENVPLNTSCCCEHLLAMFSLPHSPTFTYIYERSSLDQQTKMLIELLNCMHCKPSTVFCE